MPDLEVPVTESEQQSAVNAVVHKLLAVLAQTYVVAPVAHLSHRPVVHIVLHGLLHGSCQSGLAGLHHHIKNAVAATSRLKACVPTQIPPHLCLDRSVWYVEVTDKVSAATLQQKE